MTRSWALISMAEKRWRSLLVSVLGASEMLMALSAQPRWLAALGALGAVAVLASPWLPARTRTRRLLLAGAIPFAVLTWWSIVTPFVAVLAVGLGWHESPSRSRDDYQREVGQSGTGVADTS